MTDLFNSTSRGRRLTNQQFRSRTLPGPELLNASVAHFSGVQVAIGIDRRAVHVQEAAGVIAQRAPGIEQAPLAIVLHHFRGWIVEGPHRAIAVRIHEVNRGGIVEGPLIDELAILVEYLHPAVSTIADVDTPRNWIGGDAVDDVEVVRTRLPTAGFASLTPCGDEFSALVELHDPIAIVAVSHEHRAIRQECHESRPVEVRRVGALPADGTDRLDELFAVVRELEQRLIVVVDDPDVLLGIIRVDVDRVRASQHFVPLSPLLDDVALGVEDEDEVLPPRINPWPTFVRVGGIVRIGSRGAASRRTGVLTLRRMAERHLANRER